MFYVYILVCSDGNLYTGCTNDLKDRIERHGKGYIDSTKGRLPVKLMCYTSFSGKYKAFEFEKYLKSGSGRAFIRKHFM
ncbi:MAG: GIY-YIG nuclease family protein [Candidatus Moranbacteria bacterium]|jgi:predicted GIY-YIG superfamily endonuclease|nr:GIY-YIG nuclease family protein [Candidatus Moranbacteria bacterium]MDD5652437.1 GIY-YIG nuclease family protein [Candidatus Moranbacteria bacterium]MDX9855789.1 GIY-YIG nuclease family protein [Candidatus Moranbacteria bacterium]